LPSQKQLKWSQLRVGLTVLIASVTLAVLIFLMSGTAGWFTTKITLRSYFDNAGGLREGAPVRLAGVDIGNVESVRIVDGKPATPVEVTMKVTTKYRRNLLKDSVTLLSTAGKLLKDQELYNNLNKTVANVRQLTDDINAGKGAVGKMTHDQEFAAKLQTLVDNLSALSDRLEKGEGTAGMFFKDPTLYNNSNQVLVETRDLVKAIRENPKKYLTIHMKIF